MFGPRVVPVRRGGQFPDAWVPPPAARSAGTTVFVLAGRNSSPPPPALRTTRTPESRRFVQDNGRTGGPLFRLRDNPHRQTGSRDRHPVVRRTETLDLNLDPIRRPDTSTVGAERPGGRGLGVLLLLRPRRDSRSGCRLRYTASGPE